MTGPSETPAGGPKPPPGPDTIGAGVSPEWLAAQEFEPWDPELPTVPTSAEGSMYLMALRLAEGVCLKTKPALIESLGSYEDEDQIKATFDLIRQTRESCERWAEVCHAAEARLLVGLGVLAVRRGGGP